jgi:hypothetical protein
MVLLGYVSGERRFRNRGPSGIRALRLLLPLSLRNGVGFPLYHHALYYSFGTQTCYSARIRGVYHHYEGQVVMLHLLAGDGETSLPRRRFQAQGVLN